MRPQWTRAGGETSAFPMEQSPRTLHLCPPSAHPRPPARPTQPAPAAPKGPSPRICYLFTPKSPFSSANQALFAKINLLPICYQSATICYQSATICYLSATICYHLLPSATARHPMLCSRLSPTGAFQSWGQVFGACRSTPLLITPTACRPSSVVCRHPSCSPQAIKTRSKQ